MTAWCAKCNQPVEVDAGGCIPCRVLREKSYPANARKSAARRARLRSEGLCITARAHGPAMPGHVRCERCHASAHGRDHGGD
jgi:hypothetical protein